MMMYKSCLGALAALMIVGVCGSAKAADIAFTTGVFINENIVPTVNVVYADDLGSSTTRIPLDGVTFWADNYANNGYLYDFNSDAASHFNASGNLEAFNRDPYFGDVVNDADWSNGAVANPGLGTITGLTPGDTYQVLLLDFDDESANAGRTFQANDGTNYSAAQDYAFPFNGSYDEGGYIEGTFTADAATQTLNITGSIDQLNALVLTLVATPEPSTLAILSLLAFPLLRRRR